MESSQPCKACGLPIVKTSSGSPTTSYVRGNRHDLRYCGSFFVYTSAAVLDVSVATEIVSRALLQSLQPAAVTVIVPSPRQHSVS